MDSNGRTIFVADADRDGKRFVVRANEKLTTFVELERAVCIPPIENNANHNRGDDGKRFFVHAQEKLTAFVELEAAIRG